MSLVNKDISLMEFLFQGVVPTKNGGKTAVSKTWKL